MPTIKIKQGDTLHVTVKKRVRRKKKSSDSTHTHRSRAFLDTYSEEHRIIKKKLGSDIILYDLGTRLRSVAGPSDSSALQSYPVTTEPRPQNNYFNEYVELGLNYIPSPEFSSSFVYPNPNNGSESYPIQTVSGWDDLDRGAGFYLGPCPMIPTWRIPQSKWDEWQAAMLGKLGPNSALDLVDPTSVYGANGSARALPVCLQLPVFNSSNLWTDVVLYTGASKVELQATDAARKYIDNLNGYNYSDPALHGPDSKWKKRTAGASDGTEKWNPLNTSAGVAFEPGAFRKVKTLGTNLKVESRFYYERFDTGDTTNFKVTDTPSYSALVVSPTFTSHKQIEIWLVPKITLLIGDELRWYYDVSDVDASGQPRVSQKPTGFLPVYSSNVKSLACRVFNTLYATRLPVYPGVFTGAYGTRYNASLQGLIGDAAAKTLMQTVKTRIGTGTSAIALGYQEVTSNGLGVMAHKLQSLNVSTGLSKEAAMALLFPELTIETWRYQSARSLPYIDDGLLMNSVGAPAGRLVGMIRYQAKTYYVWAKVMGQWLGDGLQFPA